MVEAVTTASAVTKTTRRHYETANFHRLPVGDADRNFCHRARRGTAVPATGDLLYRTGAAGIRESIALFAHQCGELGARGRQPFCRGQRHLLPAGRQLLPAALPMAALSDGNRP